MARGKKKKLDFTDSQEVTLGDLFNLSDSDLPEGEAPEPESVIKPESGGQRRASRIVLRRERKGRKGKTVTLIEGLGEKGEHLEEMARNLRRDLGCGSHVEEAVVVLQGDQIERAAAWLEKKGFKNVIRGN